MTTVVRPRRVSATRSAMRASVWASTAEVGSTSTSTGGVGGDGAGQHHALALAAGEAAAALVELALPALGQRVVDVLGVGHAQRVLGLLAGEPAVRVDGVLQGAGEELAAGVADQHLAAYVVEAGAGQVDPAEGDAPVAAGALLVEGGDPGALERPGGAGPAGGAAAAPSSPSAGTGSVSAGR